MNQYMIPTYLFYIMGHSPIPLKRYSRLLVSYLLCFDCLL